MTSCFRRWRNSIKDIRTLSPRSCLFGGQQRSFHHRCSQYSGNRPPIRKFSIDPGSHVDLQNAAEFSPKGKPIRNSVSTPHRRYGHDCGRRFCGRHYRDSIEPPKSLKEVSREEFGTPDVQKRSPKI